MNESVSNSWKMPYQWQSYFERTICVVLIYLKTVCVCFLSANFVLSSRFSFEHVEKHTNLSLFVWHICLPDEFIKLKWDWQIAYIEMFHKRKPLCASYIYIYSVWKLSKDSKLFAFKTQFNQNRSNESIMEILFRDLKSEMTTCLALCLLHLFNEWAWNIVRFFSSSIFRNI